MPTYIHANKAPRLMAELKQPHIASSFAGDVFIDQDLFANVNAVVPFPIPDHLILHDVLWNAQMGMEHIVYALDDDEPVEYQRFFFRLHRQGGATYIDATSGPSGRGPDADGTGAPSGHIGADRAAGRFRGGVLRQRWRESVPTAFGCIRWLDDAVHPRHLGAETAEGPAPRSPAIFTIVPPRPFPKQGHCHFLNNNERLRAK